MPLWVSLISWLLAISHALHSVIENKQTRMCLAECIYLKETHGTSSTQIHYLLPLVTCAKKYKQQEDIFFLVKNSMCSKQPLHTIQFNNLVGKRISAEGKIKNKQIKRNLTIFASWLEVKAQTIWTHVTAYNSQSKITWKSQEEEYRIQFSQCSGLNKPYELTEGSVVINRKMEVCQIIAKSKHLSSRF